MTFKTEQESFWAGDFGKEYIGRNDSPKAVASNVALFAKALSQTAGLKSCIEFGCNIGMNLRALSVLYPDMDINAVEINKDAAAIAETVAGMGKVFNQSIFDFEPARTYDLALIKGVLIHINPDELPNVYDRLYRSSSRYILVAEYYNPSPVTISYRGHSDRLFKRDFAGEILEKFDDLELLDYGFVYKRDRNFPQDDVTWFLMQKSGR
jgi:pseudaminic acid biosynthesis-associated methylase